MDGWIQFLGTDWVGGLPDLTQMARNMDVINAGGPRAETSLYCAGMLTCDDAGSFRDTPGKGGIWHQLHREEC